MEDLRRIKETASIACAIRGDEEKDTKVIVHMGTCGIASGAQEVMRVLRERVDQEGLDVRLDEAGCIGICEREPIVSVARKGEPVIRYARVSPESILEISESHLIGGKVVQELLLSKNPNSDVRRAGMGSSKGPADPALPPAEPLADLEEVDFFVPQHRISYPVNKEALPIDDSHPVIVKDPNKCVLCGRCVRACSELAGKHNLGFGQRGKETVIAAGLNQPWEESACGGCLACVLACPTGALTEKLLHFEGKGWKPNKIYL